MTPPAKRRKSLTVRQMLFLRAYLAGAVGVRGNMFKAGEKAGFQETEVHALLALRKIKRYIRDWHARQGITIERVLSEYGKIGFADVAEFIEWDEDGGVTLRPRSQVEDTAAVKKVSVIKTPTGMIHTMIELHDKLGALRRLEKFLAPKGEDEDGQPVRFTLHIHNPQERQKVLRSVDGHSQNGDSTS